MLVLAAFVLLQAASDDVLRDLVEQLGSDRIETRGEALRKLETLGRAAIPALTKAAANPDAEISSRARALLDRLMIREHLTPALEKSVPGIEARLLQGEWREVFVEVAADLRQPEQSRRFAGVRPEDLSPMALMAISRARTETERCSVCEAVGRLKLKSAFPALLDWLKDDQPVVRMSVVTAARDAGVREYAAAIRPLLEDPLALMRAVAAHTMGLFGDQASIPVLRKLLADPSPNVRWWAVQALGELKAADAASDLEKMSADADVSVRRIAADTLQAWRK